CPAPVSTYGGLLRAPRFADGHRPDLVLRVGGAPTSKALTAWLDASVPQVLVDPGAGWLDPGRGASLRLTAAPSVLLAAVAARLDGHGPGPWLGEWLEAERRAREAIDGLL